ncbi:MAG: cytochrome c biogenesis heme-transporting ATPase CcmA [Pseudomonadota bacterium]
MLELQNLEAWRDDRCLYQALSFALRPGQVAQILGPNGVGKTTLLKQIAGLSSFMAGDIRWQDLSVSTDRQRFQRDVLFLGHLAGIKSALTVSENLQILAACRGTALSDDRLAAALGRVGLSGYDDTPVAQLSAGQKRRVALARLFTEAPLLWLLDEPFTAIDQAGVSELEGWLGDHAEQGGMVLLTTHHRLSLRCPVLPIELIPA